MERWTSLPDRESQGICYGADAANLITLIIILIWNAAQARSPQSRTDAGGIGRTRRV